MLHGKKTPSNWREIQMFISSLVPWSFPGGHSPDIDDGGVGRFDSHEIASGEDEFDHWALPIIVIAYSQR